MIDVSVSRLVKAFEEDNNILDGLTFDVNEGERVGILGKNGAGKTTLFRLMVGELSEDEGNIVFGTGKRVGLISQIPHFPAGYTTEDVLNTAFERLHEIEKRMNELAQVMAEEPTERVMREYDALVQQFEVGGGYDTATRLNKVANGLDIPDKMRGQLFDTLSGGEKTRVNLARLILEDTEILLLDEPTNHLDMRATEWLEDYLLKFKGTVLTISHDRYFLDRVVGRIIEIVHGKAEFYNGNYSFYVEEKQRRYEEQLKKYEKAQETIAQLEGASEQLRMFAFKGADKTYRRAVSIEKRIERLQQTEKPESEKKMKARFGEREFRGDEALVIKGLSKSFDGRTLFSDVELLVGGGERIALIGDNGTGKSTLLKIITGGETQDSGMVKIGPAIRLAYLEQTIRFKSPDRSIIDMMVMDENCSYQSARNRLGAFKFQGEDVYRPVSQLSGGEQSRLRLCLLMNEEINLLILDEPTNHLDISSREWIEEAVSGYDGALLFVSHDRYFINKFAGRIWELDGGRIRDYKCGFEEYRRRREAERTAEQNIKREAAKTVKKEKPKRQVSTERQLARVEKGIEKYEAELAAIEESIKENASDYERLGELYAARSMAEEKLEELYMQWTELEDGNA